MCQSSLLALVQELDDAQVYCCTGSLCNTRILDGRVAEGRPRHPTPAGPVTCLPPSPTHAPTEPDCILEEDEEEEDVVPVAGGHPPLAGSHGDREVKTTESSEGRGLEEGGAFVAGNHAASPTGGQGVTPRPGHVATGGRGTPSAEDRNNAGSRENAFSAGGVFSESNAARPTGVPHPDPVATGGPATIVLDGSSRSEPDSTKTPENAREIPAGAGLAHTEDEEEECEEETNYSARDHITGEAFVSAGSSNSPRLDHGDGSTESSAHIGANTALGARVFVAERDGHSSADSPSGASRSTVSPGDGVVAEGAGHGATDSPSLFAVGGSGTESRTGSDRESFVAEGRATSAPDGSAAASGEAHRTDGPTPGSPGNRIDTIVHIPYLATRQNESFSEDKEGGSSQPSASPANLTGTILAAGGAGAGSHRGKNKTLCTKRPGVAPVGHGLSSQEETVAKPEGSLERTEGDRDWPTISFPITVETPNSSLRGHLGNASAPGPDPVEGLVKNASIWLPGLEEGVSKRIQKGCDVEGKPNNSISFFSHGQIVMLAEEQCATDLCNQGAPDALSSFPITSSLECLSCSSSDHSCSGPSLTRIRCPDPREQCVDITAISMPEDYEESPLPLNGVTCYACEGNSSHGCAPENVTPVQCQGPMTHCMEAVGSHEAGSLRCHSHSSVLLRDRGGKRLGSVVTPNGTESCAPAHSACMEAAVTLSTGKLAVPIFVWSCQAPSCAVPPSRHVGPLQLSQAGACCAGSYCNGQRALAQVSGHVGDDPLANTTARKDHKHPGRSNGTAPTELPYPDDHTETDYPDPDDTSYYDRTEPPAPGHKGDLPHSTRPRARPTEPGKKNGYPKATFATTERGFGIPRRSRDPPLDPSTGQVTMTHGRPRAWELAPPYRLASALLIQGHGQFLVGKKGCGLGRPGTNDKGVDLHGIFAFSQVHNCNSSHCNSELDIQAMALQPMGNESARVPNGLECYSCQGNEACSPGNTTVVKCYDGYQGCFHGNVTMKVGNFSLSHPIKGCVQNKDCTKEARGSAAVNLVGSCCSGRLCNRDLANKTFFAHNIPPLEVMPAHGANATATATVAAAATVTATVTAAPTPLPPGHGDHEDHEDHGDHEDLIRDDRHVTTQGERRNNPGVKLPGGGKGGAAGLSASAWLVLLGSALLL
ncbi:cysteine synthase [Platysternon megacephalum]|uniref:Cysteine synthase n=1 Tax=Platysternon megacephalum TaxID=55544 RepID=A0A4D9DJB4_9SAUR|nr:cysteine synthase [Platysternon megacephalum]